MWTVLASGLTSLIQSWFQAKKTEQEAKAAYQMALAKGEQDWDNQAMQAAQFSWKDEFITIVWFAPLIVAWFDAEKALAWIDFVSKLPQWYQVGMFGIIAASFGLRWWFKNQAFSIKK
jgi:hypothetical protein